MSNFLVLSFVAVMSAVAGQEPERVYELPSGIVCAGYNDLAQIMESEAYMAHLDERIILRRTERLRNEFHFLCNKRPTDDSFYDGKATVWLSRADRAGEELLYLLSHSVRQVSGENDPELSGDLADIALEVQYGLSQLRQVAYHVVRTERVDVIREVPVPCADPQEECDAILRPFITEWAKRLGELTDNHDRANSAMKEAVRIKVEARSVWSGVTRLGLRVGQWSARLSDQLSLQANHDGSFRLSDEEYRILSRLAVEMHSTLSLCLE